MLTPKPPDPVPTTPLIPPEELKADFEEALIAIFDRDNDGALTKEDRADYRDKIVTWLNLKIDIPFIGEAIEGVIINLTLKAIEYVAIKQGRAIIESAVGRLS